MSVDDQDVEMTDRNVNMANEINSPQTSTSAIRSLLQVEYQWFIHAEVGSMRRWSDLCRPLRAAATRICGTAISRNFIHESFDNAHFILVGYIQQSSYDFRHTTKTIRQPVGIAIVRSLNDPAVNQNANHKHHLRIDKNNTVHSHLLHQDDIVLYIDILCSCLPGLGSTLLQRIEKYAREEKMCTKLQLSALPYVINYYRKFGFVFSGVNSTLDMEPIARLYARNPELLTIVFKDKEEPKKHRQFCNLLEKLKDQGFAHDLGSSALDEATLDGFIMSKHLNSPL